MERISVGVDTKLLRAVDGRVRDLRISRSSLVREALREYFKTMDGREKEEREREAYRRWPQSDDEIRLWVDEAVWPE